MNTPTAVVVDAMSTVASLNAPPSERGQRVITALHAADYRIIHMDALRALQSSSRVVIIDDLIEAIKEARGDAQDTTQLEAFAAIVSAAQSERESLDRA